MYIINLVCGFCMVELKLYKMMRKLKKELEVK